MTLEKAKKIIKSECYIADLLNLDRTRMVNTALDTVIEAAEETRWIPVTERVPNKGEYGRVLVTYIPSGGTLWTTVIIAHYSDLMGISKPLFHIGEVGKASFQNITEQVIAWLPLPEPYKAEGSDKE